MDNLAIRVEDVCKVYKLYDKPSDRLKDALGLVRKNHFKEHHALKHVSFEVKKGETIGIIGTNGSGKSTILKIITGVLSPTSGEVEIDGRISALLELGAGFNMEYTGIENVYLNGMMMGFSREEMDARLDDILKFADIGDFVRESLAFGACRRGGLSSGKIDGTEETDRVLRGSCFPGKLEKIYQGRGGGMAEGF